MPSYHFHPLLLTWHGINDLHGAVMAYTTSQPRTLMPPAPAAIPPIPWNVPKYLPPR